MPKPVESGPKLTEKGHIFADFGQHRPNSRRILSNPAGIESTLADVGSEPVEVARIRPNPGM